VVDDAGAIVGMLSEGDRGLRVSGKPRTTVKRKFTVPAERNLLGHPSDNAIRSVAANPGL